MVFDVAVDDVYMPRNKFLLIIAIRIESSNAQLCELFDSRGRRGGGRKMQRSERGGVIKARYIHPNFLRKMDIKQVEFTAIRQKHPVNVRKTVKEVLEHIKATKKDDYLASCSIGHDYKQIAKMMAHFKGEGISFP